MPVVDAEALIGLKLQALVNAPTRTVHEEADIRAIVAARRPVPAVARRAIDPGRRQIYRGLVQDLGRLLIGLGLLVALVGVGLLFAGRIPWLGRLPGDILVRRGPVTFYFPLATSILVSVVLSVLLALFWRR